MLSFIFIMILSVRSLNQEVCSIRCYPVDRSEIVKLKTIFSHIHLHDHKYKYTWRAAVKLSLWNLNIIKIYSITNQVQQKINLNLSLVVLCFYLYFTQFVASISINWPLNSSERIWKHILCLSSAFTQNC